MPTVARPSNMPPMPPKAEPGTQTSDRWGNVIATHAPVVSQPPASAPAPTCDRYGNIISAPPGWSSNPNHVPIPGTNFVPSQDGKSVDWK